MRIGELVERSGLSASRIRFYESSGLLNAVERKANGYREYAPEAVMTLSLIARAQKAGFSLEEIRRLMPPATGTWHRDELLEGIKGKIAEIEALQKDLARSKAQLQDLVATIENRPANLSCADNAKRVFDQFQTPGTA